nr:hypothetical protein [Candidatus Sigynarchaeota archaeon]
MADELKLAAFIFEIVAVCLDVGLGIMLTYKTRKVARAQNTTMIGRGPTQKYYTCVVAFFSAHGFYTHTYMLYGLFNNSSLFDIGVFLVIASVVLLVAAIESAIFTRSRYLFTKIGCVALAIILVDVIGRFPFPVIRLRIWVQLFVNPLLVAFIILIYINAVKRVSGSARRNALLMVVAITTFVIGELGETPFAVGIIPGAELIGAILMDIAIVLLYFGFMRLSIWKRDSQQHADVSGGNEQHEARSAGRLPVP